MKVDKFFIFDVLKNNFYFGFFNCCVKVKDGKNLTQLYQLRGRQEILIVAMY